MVEKKGATRIARLVKVGGQTHRLEIVLESDRSEGRHYVDNVCVSPGMFDRIMAFAMMKQ